MSIIVSENTLRRLPQYLMVLRKFQSEGIAFCSASRIAHELKLTSIQVRKDLHDVSSQAGIPNQGRDVGKLIDEIETFLGYKEYSQAVLVGAGKLGSALLSYKGFKDYNVKIVLAFDERIQNFESFAGIPIYHPSKLKSLVSRLHIHIGIIVVGKESAQTVCDMLVESGVKAIWNFAPVHLVVPKDVFVYHENMAESLAILSQKIKEKGGF